VRPAAAAAADATVIERQHLAGRRGGRFEVRGARGCGVGLGRRGALQLAAACVGVARRGFGVCSLVHQLAHPSLITATSCRTLCSVQSHLVA
jgi:hypothetical protein